MSRYKKISFFVYFIYLLSQQINKLSRRIFFLLPSRKTSPDKKHQGTTNSDYEITKHFTVTRYFMVFHMS